MDNENHATLVVNPDSDLDQDAGDESQADAVLLSPTGEHISEQPMMKSAFPSNEPGGDAAFDASLSKEGRAKAVDSSPSLEQRRAGRRESLTIDHIDVSAYQVPTDLPEADSSFAWDSTTIVIVEVYAGDQCGVGFTYADTSTEHLIKSYLSDIVCNKNPMDINGIWHDMMKHVRNLGESGIAAMAISAIDLALWDLKARILDLPLSSLIGQVRGIVPIYGSGGFTSYNDSLLAAQLADWVGSGIPRVKMKVGAHPNQDLYRVKIARKAIGDSAELFVDANGAYSRQQAIALANDFAEFGVNWFEEPAPSHDLAGLHFIRSKTPAGMEIAAGEYGYNPPYFHYMLEAEAVDVLQADATRCGGITGFLIAASLCQARNIPLSAHGAPSMHAHVAACVLPLRNIEYFHDHVRIENMFFDGVLQPLDGGVKPDLSQPGNGLVFKRNDAAKYLVKQEHVVAAQITALP